MESFLLLGRCTVFFRTTVDKHEKDFRNKSPQYTFFQKWLLENYFKRTGK